MSILMRQSSFETEESDSLAGSAAEGATIRKGAMRLHGFASTLDKYLKPLLATLPLLAVVALPYLAATTATPWPSLVLALCLFPLVLSGVTMTAPYAFGVVASEFSIHFVVGQALTCGVLWARYVPNVLDAGTFNASFVGLLAINFSGVGALISAKSCLDVVSACRSAAELEPSASSAAVAPAVAGLVRTVGLLLPSANPLGGFGVRRYTFVIRSSVKSGKHDDDKATGTSSSSSSSNDDNNTVSSIADIQCDVWTPATFDYDIGLVDEPLPRVALYIHGGGFVVGSKTVGVSFAMIRALALAGYHVVVPSYRRAPLTPFPGMLLDVKRVLSLFIRDPGHAGLDAALHRAGHPAGWRHGRDYHVQCRRRWVGAVGESAGAHLALLMALTPNDPRYLLTGSTLSTTCMTQPARGGQDGGGSSGSSSGSSSADRDIDKRNEKRNDDDDEEEEEYHLVGKEKEEEEEPQQRQQLQQPEQTERSPLQPDTSLQAVVDLFGPSAFGPGSCLRGRLGDKKQQTFLTALRHVVLQPAPTPAKPRGAFGVSAAGEEAAAAPPPAGKEGGDGNGSKSAALGEDDPALDDNFRAALAAFSPTAELMSSSVPGAPPTLAPTSVVPPIMAVHGDLDEVVPLDDTLQFFRLLQEARREGRIVAVARGKGNDGGKGGQGGVEDVLLVVRGAHHGFVLLPSPRSFAVADAVVRFLARC